MIGALAGGAELLIGEEQLLAGDTDVPIPDIGAVWQTGGEISVPLHGRATAERGITHGVEALDRQLGALMFAGALAAQVPDQSDLLEEQCAEDEYDDGEEKEDDGGG